LGLVKVRMDKSLSAEIFPFQLGFFQKQGLKRKSLHPHSAIFPEVLTLNQFFGCLKKKKKKGFLKRDSLKNTVKKFLLT